MASPERHCQEASLHEVEPLGYGSRVAEMCKTGLRVALAAFVGLPFGEAILSSAQ